MGTWSSNPTGTAYGVFQAELQHANDDLVVTIKIDLYGTTNYAAVASGKALMESVVDALVADPDLTVLGANYTYTDAGGEAYTP